MNTHRDYTQEEHYRSDQSEHKSSSSDSEERQAIDKYPAPAHVHSHANIYIF